MSKEIDLAIRVQTLVKAVCTNTLRKDMNPTIPPPAMDKIVGKTEIFNFGMATGLGEGKLHLKIDLVFHPAHTEGLSKCINSEYDRNAN